MLSAARGGYLCLPVTASVQFPWQAHPRQRTQASGEEIDRQGLREGGSDKKPATARASQGLLVTVLRVVGPQRGGKEESGLGCSRTEQIRADVSSSRMSVGRQRAEQLAS